jgi:hypothetical protein
MAELGARYPSAGGVMAFIGKGLGEPVGWLTGVLYMAAMVVGGPATALVFSAYLGQIVPLSSSQRFLVAALVLAALILGNCFDVSVVMRLQRWVFFACLAAIAVALFLALPHIVPGRLTDTAGYSTAGIASTSLICFFAFVGWENAAFSGEEFSDPRTLLKALGLAVALVGALFVLLGITVVGGLSRSVIATSNASLADLARLSLGDTGAGVASVIALVLLILLMFTWTRSATRLIYALARQGVLPRPLARVDQATGSVPRAALALAVAWAVALLLQFLLGISVETYIVHPAGQRKLSADVRPDHSDGMAPAAKLAVSARTALLLAGDAGAGAGGSGQHVVLAGGGGSIRRCPGRTPSAPPLFKSCRRVTGTVCRFAFPTSKPLCYTSRAWSRGRDHTRGKQGYPSCEVTVSVPFEETAGVRLAGGIFRTVLCVPVLQPASRQKLGRCQHHPRRPGNVARQCLPAWLVLAFRQLHHHRDAP